MSLHNHPEHSFSQNHPQYHNMSVPSPSKVFDTYPISLLSNSFKMRCEQSKLTTVKALQSIGFETIASGDSYNDLGMIKASKAGFLFKSTEQIKKDNPELAAYETYDELLAAIKEHLD